MGSVVIVHAHRKVGSMVKQRLILWSLKRGFSSRMHNKKVDLLWSKKGVYCGLLTRGFHSHIILVHAY